MSNLINNILTNENAVTTSSSNLSSEQAVKDKPSLFDSLLANSVTSEESKVNTDIKQDIKTDVTTIISDKDIKVDEATVEKTNTEGLKLIEEVDNNEQKLAGVSSLLDRLILEAKNSAKEETNVENKIEATQVIKDIKSEDKKVNITVDEELIPTNTKEILSVDKAKLNVEVKQEILPIKTEVDKLHIDKSKEINVKVDEALINKVNIEPSNISDKIQEKEQETTETTTSLVDKVLLETQKSADNVVIKESKEVSDLNNNVELPKEQTKIDIEVIKEIKPESINLEVKTEETKSDNKKAEIKSIKTDITNILEKVDTKIENNTATIEESEIKKVDNIEQKVVDTNILNTTSIEPNNILLDSATTKEVIIDTISDKSVNIDLNTNNSPLTNGTLLDAAIEKIEIKKEVKLSLMDQLIQKNSEKLTIDNVVSEDSNLPLKDVVTKDLISNIYLGSQKNKITNQNLFNKNEAISLLKDGNSIQAVKTSAEMLNLGLESVNVEQEIELDNIDLKKSNIDLLNKKNLVDSLLLKNDIRGEEVKDLITKSVEASNAIIDNTLTVADDVTVNVNSPLSYNIQSRIIGAKQQMSAMMSDIAKQMYENYKPPVTAFKINLNPLDLGSIAILMKNDKNNGITISMNVSNNVTLDTLIENQNILKNSLNKTFEENTKFNLDFSSSNQNNSNQSSNNSQGKSKQFEQQMDTKSILELQEENKDREEKVIDYM